MYKILQIIDYGIYLDVEEEIRLKRRIERDIKFRGRSRQEVEKRYFKMCKPMHNKYIDPSKTYADIILKTNDIKMKNILNLISKKSAC